MFGALFQFTSGKRGKRMFPNHDFWCVAVPGICKVSTVLPAKSDSDAVFCLQTYQGLTLHVVTEMHFLLQKNLKNIMHGRVKMYVMR